MTHEESQLIQRVDRAIAMCDGRDPCKNCAGPRNSHEIIPDGPHAAEDAEMLGVCLHYVSAIRSRAARRGWRTRRGAA